MSFESFDKCVIIVISTTGDHYPHETKILNDVGHGSWKYVSFSTELKKDVICNDTTFILYNQSLQTDFSTVVTAINNINKSVLLFSHITDNLVGSATVLNTLFNECIYAEDFNHDGRQPIEMLMRCIGTNNYSVKYQELIKSSIKKKHRPHLITFILLCEGYLAEHNKFSITNNILKDEKTVSTETSEWWCQALTPQSNFNDSELLKEIKPLNHEFLSMVSKIYSTSWNTENQSNNTDLVEKAYNFIITNKSSML